MYTIWIRVADELSGTDMVPGLPSRPTSWSRYVITMPSPFSVAASGSSSGSAHGASRRTARCAAASSTTNAIMYSAMPDGSEPFRPRPTLA